MCVFLSISVYLFESKTLHDLCASTVKFRFDLPIPEVIRQAVSDLYIPICISCLYSSFGCLIYQVIAKQAPYSGAPPGLIRETIIGRRKPDLEPLNHVERQLASSNDESIFQLLRSLMAKCWIDEPKGRPSSKEG